MLRALNKEHKNKKKKVVRKPKKSKERERKEKIMHIFERYDVYFAFVIKNIVLLNHSLSPIHQNA